MPDTDKPRAEGTRRWWQLSPDAVVGSIAVVLVGALTIAFAHWDIDGLRSDLRTGMVEVSGQTVLLDGKAYTPPKGPLRVQFWTPSVRTKETPGVKAWERLDNDAKLVAFGDALMDRKIATGYRRYDVTGSGLGGRKQGTWWVASGDFKFVDFLKLYRDVWQPGGDDVYMEIASAAAGHGR